MQTELNIKNVKVDTLKNIAQYSIYTIKFRLSYRIQRSIKIGLKHNALPNETDMQ